MVRKKVCQHKLLPRASRKQQVENQKRDCVPAVSHPLPGRRLQQEEVQQSEAEQRRKAGTHPRLLHVRHDGKIHQRKARVHHQDQGVSPRDLRAAVFRVVLGGQKSERPAPAFEDSPKGKHLQT